MLFVADLLRRHARLEPANIELNTQMKPFADVWPRLVLEDELIKHCNKRAVSTRVVVPALLREQVFRLLHEPAHYRYKATLHRISQRFWWPRVRADVSALVKACKAFDRDRVANLSLRAPFGHLPAEQPFAALYIDNVGGQGSLSLGVSKIILTMIDGLTGWAEALPISEQSAATVARAVYTEWISRIGVSEQLHFDLGVQFDSAVYAELCAMFGIDKTRTNPYRTQTNGKCNWFNRTLISMLRRSVQKGVFDWEPLLSPVLKAYLSIISEATGITPYRLTLGCEMRLPIDLETPLPKTPRDIRTMAAEVAENLEFSYQIAREIISYGHRRAEPRYNERIVKTQYTPGSLFRIIQYTHRYGVPTKLNLNFS